jgi:hypothetical protein
MATQNHQLNFILNLKSQGFNSGMAKVVGQISKLQKTVAGISQTNAKGAKGAKGPGKQSFLAKMLPLDVLKALGGPLGRLAGKLGALYATQKIGGFFLRKTIGDWGKFYVQMQDIRRETQMTQTDIAEFSSQVISSSASYGIALNKVANMARFVGQGMNLARTGVARLAGDLQNVAELTATTDETMGKFGHFLHRQLRLTEDQAFQSTVAITALSRATNVAQEQITTHMNNAQKAISIMAQEVGPQEAVNRMGALIASMVKAGARTEDVSAVTDTLSDRQSKLFRILAANEFEFSDLQNVMTGVNKQISKGGLAAAATERTWSLGVQTLKSLHRALGGVKETQAATIPIMNMNRKALQNYVEQDMSPLQRIGRAFNKFWTDQVKAINELAGPAVRQWAQDWGFAAEIMLNKFRELTKWLGGKMYETWTGLKATFTETDFSALGRNIQKWIIDKIQWASEKVSGLLTNFRSVREFWDDLTGLTEKRADQRLRLISRFAEQQAKGGMSHADANALARSKIQSDLNAAGNYSTLTHRERAAAVRFGLRPQVPETEAPANTKDPSLKLLQDQVNEIKNLRAELKEERQKRELQTSVDRVRTGNLPSTVSDASVTAART